MSTPELWPAPVAHAAIDATVAVPGSKSETNRALVLAALADAPSRIEGGLSSRDSNLMRAALGQLGVTVEETPEGAWLVTPPLRFEAPTDPIDCGLAGTVMRFVPPLAALTGGTTRFVGDAHASERPMAPLLAGLRQLGVEVEGDRLPLSLTAPTLLSGRRVEIDSSGSSQFVSALLLVGARLPLGLELVHVPAEPGGSVPSRPHIEMTVQMLRARGVDVQCPDANTWQVAPGPVRALDSRVEPDLTNAAVFLAAGALTRGQVAVPGWPQETTQGGAAILPLLERAGARISQQGDVLTAQADGPLRALGEVDLHASSELTPVVAGLASLLDGETRISGVAHIRGHETDRLRALATELCRVGALVEETDDGLRIIGRGPAALHGAVWQSYADHRMAHAGALVGLLVPGIEVEDISCTTKTIADFPGMWAAMLAQQGDR